MFKGLAGLTIFVMAASGQPPPAAGSISGTVVDSRTGAPMAQVPVRMRGGISATTDAQGRYTLRSLPPGRYRIAAGGWRTGTFSTRMVSLAAGQKLDSIDFTLQVAGTISGRVVDENREPIADLEIVLVAREYFAGALRYYRREVARTNDRGEYRLQDVPPGTAFLLLARQRNLNMNPVSEVPADPKLRRPTPARTYYPGSSTPEGGELLTLRAGENREGVDFRLQQSPSYCAEGILRDQGRPAVMSFWIAEPGLSFGLAPSGGVSGRPPGGKTGTDGKVRICGLHTGEYQLTAFSGDLNSPESFGTASVTITGRDVQDLSVIARPRLPLSGRVEWAGAPPAGTVSSQIRVLLNPLHRTAGGMGQEGVSSVPGEFSVKEERGQDLVDLLRDEYSVRILGLTGSLYVKDITYGTESVFYSPLRLGSAIPGTELHVVLGHDGGTLDVKVADKDGNPVFGGYVIVMPKDVHSEPDLAAKRIVGETDQNGAYFTRALAPGAYHVLATTASVADPSRRPSVSSGARATRPRKWKLARTRR